MSKKNWSKALQIAEKANNETLKKIVLSSQFLDTSYKKNGFTQISNFLLSNPVWPQKHLLQIQAENLLDKKLSDSEIIKFFTKYPPITSKGRKYYAYSISRANPQSPFLPIAVKEGWIRGNFELEEQKKYYRHFSKYLTQKDHLKKIDYLLMNHRITEAKRVYQYIDAKLKRPFNAQISLIKKPDNSKAIFNSLPKEAITAAVLYRYLDNMKKKYNFTTPEKINKLVYSVKSETEYGDLIWRAQHYIAREYLDHKQYRKAYKVVSFHFAQDAINKSNAEFLAGWLALEFLREPKLALKHFKQLNKIVSSPISKSRSLYWMGRTYQKLGDMETASKLYNMVARRYPYSFYGQVGLIEIGGKTITLPKNFDISTYEVGTKSNVKRDKNKIFLATNLVSKYGPTDLSQIYISFAASKIKNLNEAKDFLLLFSDGMTAHQKHWFARRVLFNKLMITNYNYPLPYELKNSVIDPGLIYSIIRQESAFNKYARSKADARGLMQLLEETAKETALLIKDDYYNSAHLMQNEHYNIRLGSNYLASLLTKFNGSYILAIAAYNAGPEKVEAWIEKFGDPRKITKYRDVLNWIEMIPYAETRNYVQRVIENLEVYRSILYPHNRFQLKNRLVFSSARFC
ncbi:MAG TPA: lytic transglycosylase domain-containing protein [Candidatus Megaira endosymbiont of Nemacystus decipiens]|nr:lytic transglycosylase domain-containing protein [Candidatus Megaera endosymbiont of Nemacystus decipiens]